LETSQSFCLDYAIWQINGVVLTADYWKAIQQLVPPLNAELSLPMIAQRIIEYDTFNRSIDLKDTHTEIRVHECCCRAHVKGTIIMRDSFNF